MTTGFDKLEKPEALTPEKLLRLWRTAGVPVDAPERQAQRRAKTVGVVAAAMRAASRQRVRRRRVATALLAAAGVCLMVLGSSWLLNRSQAELTSAEVVNGSVRVERSGRTLELEGGAAVGEGDSLQTSDAEAEVRLGAHKIHLSRDTKARIGPILQYRHRVTLARGGIDFDVDKHSDDERFVVSTHDAKVLVRGTRFRVEVSGVGDLRTTTVSVSRGSVRVEPKHGAPVLLHVGERWSSSSRPSSNGLSVTKSSSAGTLAEAVARSNVAQPLPAARDGRGETTVEHGETAALSNTVRSNTVRSSTVRSSTMRSNTMRSNTVRSNTGDSAKKLGPRTATLRHGKRYSHSSGRSKKGARKGSLAQENALFQAALRARNAGNDSLALRYLDSLLARFPESTLAQEAGVERFRALRRMGQTAEAARSARRYLAEHRDGFARQEARDLVLKSVLEDED